MNNKSPLLIILGVVLAIVVFNSVFLVYQWEKAIKLRFGEIIASDYEPGIHLKWPLVNTIRKFDARLRTLDARPERFLTLEKKDVIVDSYVKWRIANVAQYYRSTGGSADKTSRLLAERINTALRNEFGKRTIKEVVSGERQEIMDLLTKNADVQANDLGVEVLDVRVKQIDLPAEVSESVYGRMSAERERVARDLRAKGAEAAERIRADADRQRVVILAEAYRDAEKLRGEGDAKAAKIYADAFTKDAEFYAFWRSLSAYGNALGGQGDVMVLKPDSEFFRFFNSKK